MADDLDRAIRALKAADAAGNAEDARALAKVVRNLQAARQPAAPAERAPVTQTEGILQSAQQGLLLGFGDEYTAATAALAGANPQPDGSVKWLDYSRPFSERYDAALTDARRDLDEYRQANPGRAMTAQVAGGLATGIAGAGRVAAAQTAAGRLGQVAAGGAAAGAVEGFGSGEGGLRNRAESAAIGAGIGAVFAPLVGIPLARVVKFANDRGGKALRSVFTNRRLYNRNTGQLTEAGAARLRDLGIDAAGLSQEMQEAFGVVAERQVNATGGDVARQGTALRFGVPLTAGQATGDVIQSGAEEAFRAGARGRGAQEVMQGFDAAQGAAVEQARESVGASIGGPAVDRTDAADAVIDGVRREAESARQAGSQAYEALEAAGAAISPGRAQDLGAVVQNRVRMSGFDLGPQTPNATSAVDFLQNTLGGVEGDSIPFMQIERARQQLVRLRSAAQSGSTGADQTAMGAVVDAYDEWVDDAITTALMQGDEAVIGKAQEARALWGRYRQTFLSRGGADNFVRKIVTDDLSPDQVAGWLYGGATTPGGGSTALVARRVRDILGPDSPEWMMVKRAAFEHITKAPEGKSFGPQRIASNLSEMISGKGKALSRELFTEAEIKQIGQFRDLLKVIVPPPRSTNPSGTAYELQRGMMEVMGTITGGATGGPLGAVVGREALTAGGDFSAKLKARAATRGVTFPSSPLPAVTGGAAAGAALQEQTVR